MSPKTGKPRKFRTAGTQRTKRARRVSSAPRSLLSLFPEYRKRAYQKKVKEQRKSFIAELTEAYSHKGLVLYLGAGVSRSVGLPGWAELIRSLTVTMMTRKVHSAMNAIGGLSEDKYWKSIQSIQRDVESGTDADRPILMMARSIKDRVGRRSTPSSISHSLSIGPLKNVFPRCAEISRFEFRVFAFSEAASKLTAP